MNNLKTNPIGIDVEIQEIQTKLYESLDWNIEAFGRVYKDEKGNPIWFYKNDDYKNVLSIKDSTNGRFFFVESDNTTTKNQISTTQIDVIFLLNIAKIKPTVPYRADEEVKIDIQNVLRKHLTRINPTITKGIKALEGFETKLKDIQPYHFIKFTFNINYKHY